MSKDPLQAVFEYGRFFNVQGMKVTISFDKQLVDWINKEFPDYNWYPAEGPMCTSVSLFERESRVLQVKNYDMADFAFPVGLMFDSDYNKIEKLIRRIAEYLTNDIPKHSDIYLLSMRGLLSPLNEDGYITELTNLNGNPLATVGVKCDIRYVIDDGEMNDEIS